MGQVFVAPGPEDEPLPDSPSFWHHGRTVWLPMEHWEAVLSFAERLSPDETARLRAYSSPECGRILPSDEEIEASLSFVCELVEALAEGPALVPEANEVFAEDYSNQVHIRMLQAVAAVLAEAKRLGQPFVGEVDT